MTKACVLCRATLAPADFSPRFCAECITCLSHNGVDVTPLASPACSRQRPSTPPTLERGVSVQAVTPRRRRRSKTSSRTPKVKNTTLSQAAPSSAAFNPTPIARALLYEARRTKPFTSYDNASRAVSPKDVEKLYPKPSCQDGGSATCPFQVSKSANVISSQFLALSTLGLNIVPKKLRNETGGTQPVSPEQTSFQASKQITSENCVLQCHSTNTDRIRAQSQASDENDGISTSAVKNGNLIANVLSSRTFENRTNTASQSPLIQPTSDGRPKKRRRLERLRSVSPSSVQETPPSAQCSQRSQGETPSRLFATSINQITEKSAKSNPCDENVQPYEQSHARNISARKQTQMKSRMLTPHSRSKPSLQHRTLSTARRPSHSHQYWPAPGVAHAPPDSARFFVLDTETSGLDSTLDRVIEVAITEYHRGQWETPFSLLVNIGDSPLEPSTTVVHGITRQMLVGAPSFAAVWDRVRAYVTIRTLPHETPVIIAHNAAFDAAFLVAEARRARRPIPDWRWACTIQLADKLWPEQEKGLAALARRLGAKGGGPAHRAASDVHTLCAVLDGMAAVAESRKQDVFTLLPSSSRPMSQFVPERTRKLYPFCRLVWESPPDSCEIERPC